MNNNRLLKIYLSVAAASIVLFAITFTVGLNVFDNIGSLINATLPFVASAVASLLCFGFTPAPVQSAEGAVHKPRKNSNVVRFNPYREQYAPLRKIS